MTRGIALAKQILASNVKFDDERQKVKSET
jgi:hypothetical protein